MISMDARIYVCTHKQYTKPDAKLYRSLHVGKALGEELGYEGDDTGDSISHKNKNYCELTGVYWIWKNVDCDVAGICHYRRYFEKDGALLSEDDTERILAEYDVILPMSSCTKYRNLYEHYDKRHYIKDMEICRQVVAEKYPDYLTALDLCMHCNFFSMGNMMIAPKAIFDSYCAWLFDILFEVEKRVDISGYDPYQARIMGYLSERLLRVWFLHHSYKIKELAVKMIDPQEEAAAADAAALKRRYVSLMIRDVLQSYQQKHVRYEDKGKAAGERTQNAAGQERMPVWIFWAQGETEAPETVKLCIDSARRRFPKDKAQVRVLDIGSVGQYVPFPQHIIDKYNQGKIMPNYLADFIKAAVLYQYGGLWMNPSVYVARQPEDAWFDDEKMRMDKSGAVIKTHAENILFLFLWEACCKYWENCDAPIDGDLWHYMLDAAQTCIDGFADIALRSEEMEAQLADLDKSAGRRYRAEFYEALTAGRIFGRLSWKKTYPKENIVGQQTVYGHLLQGGG